MVNGLCGQMMFKMPSVPEKICPVLSDRGSWVQTLYNVAVNPGPERLCCKDRKSKAVRAFPHAPFATTTA